MRIFLRALKNYSSRGRFCRRAGFTLIEIVVAIGIFAISASLLLFAINNAYSVQEAFLLRDVRHEDRKEILRTLLSLSQSDPDVLDNGGEYQRVSGETARWEAYIEETLQANLFHLILTINWGDSSEEETFDFYLFRPAWKNKFNNQESLLENLREAFPQDRFNTY